MTSSKPGAPRRRKVIYARISDDREGRQNGVDRQVRQCRALADTNGDEIVAVFVDDDRSAYSGKPRPDYLKMLQFLKEGHADGAYALAPTRFYRRLDDGLEFFKLVVERKLEIQTVKQGRYDLSTADGRRDALRAAVDAQHEAEQISERVRDAKADNVARGEYRGGPRPFGYEADGVTLRSIDCPSCAGQEGFTADRMCKACGAEGFNVPGSEAWHAENATKGVVAGESLRSLSHAWAKLGVVTVARRYKQPDGTKGEPESRPWSPIDMRKMLLRARNAGLIEHEGEVVGKAQWPGFVNEATWTACRAILKDPDRRTNFGNANARVWIGGSLYLCWCGDTVRGRSVGTGGRRKDTDPKSWPAYRCNSGKNHVARGAAAVDEYVQALAIERLSRPDAAELLIPVPEQRPREDLAAQSNALRTKLDTIAADYAEDLMTRKQMLDATAKTRARLDELSTKMAGQSATSVLASLPLGTPEIADQWDSYHLDKKRAIIDALMTVTIKKSRRGRPPGYKAGSGAGYFDESSIQVDWKSPA